jgi:LPXTG-site transpeptidase (sortase) family protein
LITNIDTYIQEKNNLPTDHSSIGLPVCLRIPNININAMVDSVGLTPDGAMDVPQGPSDVAWFNLGPRPGENGSSVIDGHSGWKDGIPAVFDNLDKLHIGDKLSVEDHKGNVISFVVRELKTYSPYENAPAVFNSNDGKAHLNLITCTGDWNETEKSHSERLVVFTDKE